MTNFKFVIAALILPLSTAAFASADCCADEPCCHETAACCHDQGAKQHQHDDHQRSDAK